MLTRRRLLENCGAFGAFAFVARPRGRCAVRQSGDGCAQRVHERGRCARASRRSRREGQASHPRHAGRDGFGIGAAAGALGDQFRAVASRREGRDGCGVQQSCAVRSKQRSRTRCWRIPTRPTIRMRPRSRIPVARSFRPPGRPPSSSDRWLALPARRDARLRHRDALHHDRRRAWISKRESL